MPNLYASLEDIKAPGMLNITNNDYDSPLLDAIEEGSRQFDRDTDRFYYIYETTYYQDGGSVRLILDWDVQSITSLKVDMDGSGAYSTSYNLTSTPVDAFLYPLNETPKTRLEVNPFGAVGHLGPGLRKSVQITGVFGYGADWPQSYTKDSGTVLSATITSTATTLTVSTGNLIDTGNTLRIGSEQIFIYNTPVGLTIPIQRAMNGTTAGTPTTGTSISIYQYPNAVKKAVLIYAMRIWKRRESAFQNQVGNPELGTVTVWKGNDPDYDKAVIKYSKVRRGWYPW